MIKRFAFLILLAQLCFGASCATMPSLPPFKQLENYRFDLSKPLQDRVTVIPALLLESLKKLDNREDYHSYTPTTEEMAQLSSVLDEIPELQRSVLFKRMIGIYFVSNLSSGGYSDYIFDKDGSLYTVLVLNPALLHTPLSRWIADKEVSAFQASRGNIVFNVDCHENGRTALLYIMLHETAHHLDYLAGCTPYVEKDLAYRGKPLTASEFVLAAWKDYDRPRAEYDFRWRSRLGFYGAGSEPRPDRNELAAVYGDLADTPFATLYASQNWAEDFAETAAFSALASITGKACRMRVSKPGAGYYEFSTIDRPKVAARLPLLYSSCGSQETQKR